MIGAAVAMVTGRYSGRDAGVGTTTRGGIAGIGAVGLSSVTMSGISSGAVTSSDTADEVSGASTESSTARPGSIGAEAAGVVGGSWSDRRLASLSSALDRRDEDSPSLELTGPIVRHRSGFIGGACPRPLTVDLDHHGDPRPVDRPLDQICAIGSSDGDRGRPPPDDTRQRCRVGRVLGHLAIDQIIDDGRDGDQQRAREREPDTRRQDGDCPSIMCGVAVLVDRVNVSPPSRPRSGFNSPDGWCPYEWCRREGGQAPFVRVQG